MIRKQLVKRLSWAMFVSVLVTVVLFYVFRSSDFWAGTLAIGGGLSWILLLVFVRWPWATWQSWHAVIKADGGGITWCMASGFTTLILFGRLTGTDIHWWPLVVTYFVPGWFGMIAIPGKKWTLWGGSEDKLELWNRILEVFDDFCWLLYRRYRWGKSDVVGLLRLILVVIFGESALLVAFFHYKDMSLFWLIVMIASMMVAFKAAFHGVRPEKQFVPSMFTSIFILGAVLSVVG